MSPDGAASLVSRLPDVVPWSFCPGSGGTLWIGSAGGGKIYRLESRLARTGTVVPKPRDFSLVSTWGQVSWRAEVPRGASVSCETRSGNSETPDDTWSKWSSPIEAPGGRIESPPARFLQYRLKLTSNDKAASPVLWGIRLSGIQENVRPMVVSVDASPMPGGRSSGGGGRSGGNDAGKGSGRAEPARDTWKVAWSAADANGDDLVYDLYYRGRGERNWKLLADDLTEPSYNWLVDSAPEGTMEVRVVASDRPSNPRALSLSSERVSAPFDIDHTPPAVDVQAKVGPGRVAMVECAVTDLTSPLKEASYSLDAQDWEVIFPVDGIFDSSSETLRISLQGMSTGEHSVVVRAVDTLGNVGVGRAILEVK